LYCQITGVKGEEILEWGDLGDPECGGKITCSAIGFPDEE